MKLCNSPGGIALILSALILSMAPNVSRADLAPISRDFRNFCQSLNMKCGRTPAKKPRKAAAARLDKKSKAVTSEVITSEKTKAPVPVPRSKPTITAVSKPIETAAPTIKASAPELKKAIAPEVKDPPPERKAEEKIASIARPQKNVSTTETPDVAPAIPDASCLASLRNSGVQFDAIATSMGDGSCRVDTPVRVHAIQTAAGKITLPESPLLSCQFAQQFGLWLSDSGAALVSTHLKMTLRSVSTGPGYECRGRNGEASAKLSEHAFGNAVDITTLMATDGRVIHIADAIDPTSPSFQVLRSLRTTACGYFTTVLGPGSNAAHATHFHFDTGMHGKSKNYRICE